MTYREMNQLPGVDHAFPHQEGLTVQQMVQVLESAGARCFQANYPDPDAPPFQKYIYGSIESGYPAIVIFATTDPSGDLHAVPVFGHTFNQDTGVPNADVSYFKIGEGTKYIPSESWPSTFMAHDDTWGSNYCIPRHYLRSMLPAAQGQRSSPLADVAWQGWVAHVIGTMPREVRLNPGRAEIIGADYLFTIVPQLDPTDHAWARRLLWYARQDLLVLRPYLLSFSAYLAHLAQVRDWQGRALDQALLAKLKHAFADEKFWMIELSVPELFSANLRKLGEVLIRAEGEPSIERDLSSFVLARLPGYFVLLVGGTASDPQYQFIPSGASGHVELIGCEDAASTDAPAPPAV